MDPRFPPQPSPVRVPLYPDIADDEALADPSAVRTDLLEAVGVSDERVRFGASASDLFADYLVFLGHATGRSPTVGLPAYICPHFCARIRSTGRAVVFLDLDASYFYSTESCDFAAEHGVDVLVWPMFFGSRALPTVRLAYASAMGMRNVVDEAQSFPGSDIRREYDTLVSFGRSKRLNASGGGALIFSDAREASEFEKMLARATRGQGPAYRAATETGRAKRHVKMPMESELPTLLDRLEIGAHELGSTRTDRRALREAAFGLRRLREQADELAALREAIRSFVIHRFGEAALDAVSRLTGEPTIFGIRIPADLRYEIAQDLAKKGIQTTWYYYPANRIRAFAGSTSMYTDVCDRLSAEILILPFGAKVAAACLQNYRIVLRNHD